MAGVNGASTLSGRIATDIAACMVRRKKASAVSAEKAARRRAEREICLNCPLKECTKGRHGKRGCPLAAKKRKDGRRDI